MPTTPAGLYYPALTDAVADAGLQMQLLAESVDGLDTWKTVGAAGQPPFSNGWASFAGDPVQFCRPLAGWLALRGSAAGGGAGAIAFTLPAAYRPPADRGHIVVWGTNPAGACTIDVSAAGAVRIYNQTGSNRVWLDGFFVPIAR